MTPVYLDYNASTPVLPRVRAAMDRALNDGFANPSADHVYGKRARAFVETARAQVAALLGCDTDEILFTSGGTESNNLALRGLASATPTNQLTIITSEIEHPATAQPAAQLGRQGATVVRVAPGAWGAVAAEDFERALAAVPSGRRVLVSVILAQNETGVIQPIADIARLAFARGAIVHTDAAQAVGKIPVDVRRLGVDLLSIAGHKLYAPKGVGALFVRRGTPLAPFLLGAGHEHGLRPGTENVVGIAALGEACALAREDVVEEAARQKKLRAELEQRLARGGFVVVGHRVERLPNTTLGRFLGLRGSDVLARTPAIAASTGSACHAGEEQPSKVLLAMGAEPEDALGAIRLTLGRGTTESDLDRAIAALLEAVG
jgi:cysteine desulfurase